MNHPPDNRLHTESSPYLRQHADNPVAWQPWDDEALALARRLGKPILLSIGYSACHWCHVMAHESFEDDATAAVMNTHFVNIKVDREERPDLDKVYQLAHHLLTQSQGGWPLTMFLDPDTLLPFYGGTYFPKRPQFGLPSFTDLLLRISEVFADKRTELAEQGKKIETVMRSLHLEAQPAQKEDLALLLEARTQLGQQYDATNGGFGNAPKFPMPATVERLLRHWAFRNHAGERDREALDMVMTTLTRMARGGIFDHLGGGWCRYSTDAQWMIPHFEKMLYDNGQLLNLYAQALQVTPDPLFTSAVSETAHWMIREMQHPGGAFYAALDADSEGEEGRFYVWRKERVKRLLTEDEYLVVETLYGLDKAANFEGSWNLHRRDAWRSVVERLSLDMDTANALLASARAKLFEERETRVRPGLDDKILAAWNGLAIEGLARASAVLGERSWLEAAQRAMDFMRTHLWADGRLYATWKNNVARHPAYLDDYAALISAALTLCSVAWRDQDIRFAVTLADFALEQFTDPARGGFFFTANDHEALIHRPKPTMDDAMPPGNGIMARALFRLGHLTGRTKYLDAAAATLRWARPAMEQYPAGHASLLSALEDEVYPPQIIIIRGPTALAETWADKARNGYQPWRAVYAIPYEGVSLIPDFLPALIRAEERKSVTAFICEGLSCSLPIRDEQAFETALKGE